MTTEAPTYSPICRLPTELLKEIFGHLQDPRLLHSGNPRLFRSGDPRFFRYGLLGHDREELPIAENRSAIASARLACRLFNNAASEFLVAELTVRLDQTSLDKLERFSRNSLLARGVHGLRLNLAYRDKRMAEDPVAFFNYRYHCMRQLYRHDTSTANGPEHPYTAIDIVNAWDEHIDDIIRDLQPEDDEENDENGVGEGDEESNWEGDEEGNEEDNQEAGKWRAKHARMLREARKVWAKYARILREGFAEFGRKHEEQRDLVESGSFLRQFMASISRLPLCRTLIFSDEDDRGVSGSPGVGRVIPEAMDALSELVSGPYPWQELENLASDKRVVNYRELAPARLLAEIPIALQRMGRPLHHFQVEYFPRFPNSIPHLTNNTVPGPGSNRYNLMAAFGSLRAAVVESFGAPYDSIEFDRYISTITDGQRLEVFVLHGWYGMRLFAPRPSVHFDLSSFASQNLRCVRMTDVSVRADDFRRFCDERDTSRMTLQFWHIDCPPDDMDEDWEGLSESMRERAKERGVSLHSKWVSREHLFRAWRTCGLWSFQAHPCEDMAECRCSLCWNMAKIDFVGETSCDGYVDDDSDLDVDPIDD